MQAVTTGKQTISPNIFLIAANVSRVLDYTTPVNIIIGFSTEGGIFAAKFPTTNFINSSFSSEYWSNFLLASNFITYSHLKGTSLIIIQYTVALGSGNPVGCTDNFCLGLYNLNLLEKNGSYTFKLTKMMT